jgi:hypothetical protein
VCSSQGCPRPPPPHYTISRRFPIPPPPLCRRPRERVRQQLPRCVRWGGAAGAAGGQGGRADAEGTSPRTRRGMGGGEGQSEPVTGRPAPGPPPPFACPHMCPLSQYTHTLTPPSPPPVNNPLLSPSIAGWGETAEGAWGGVGEPNNQGILTRPFIAGGNTWTMFDYRGEPSEYNSSFSRVRRRLQGGRPSPLAPPPQSPISTPPFSHAHPLPTSTHPQRPTHGRTSTGE